VQRASRLDALKDGNHVARMRLDLVQRSDEIRNGVARFRDAAERVIITVCNQYVTVAKSRGAAAVAILPPKSPVISLFCELDVFE